MRQLDKAEMRQRGRQLRALLNEWDPIGVSKPDGPADEYDCLLWPLIRQLEGGDSADALAAFLANELDDHFGLTPQHYDVPGFAKRLWAWYHNNWHETRV